MPVTLNPDIVIRVRRVRINRVHGTLNKYTEIRLLFTQVKNLWALVSNTLNRFFFKLNSDKIFNIYR